MPQEIFFTRLQRSLIHPANAGVQIRTASGQIIEAYDHVAAAHVNVVFQAERHRLRTKRLRHRVVVIPDVFDGGLEADGQHHNLLSLAHDAAGDLSAQAAEVVQRVVGRTIWAIDPLNGESQRAQIPVTCDVDSFQMREQVRAFVPRRIFRSVHHVVAVERADGNELHVAEHVELRQKTFNLVADFQEPILAPAHEIHFVDRDDEVRNPQQRRDVGVAPRLFDDALARIHEDDGKIRGRSAGDHVARVLHMPRRVGDDELAFWRGEVAIGHVNRDALLAFGAQAVGEIGQIDLSAAGDVGAPFERFDLILH